MKFKSIAVLALLALSAVSVQAFAQTSQEQEANRQTTEALLSKVATLTPAQKAELLNSAKAIETGSTAAQTTREWVDIGTSLGQGLAATARELGVAVNEFARSPVGILAIVLIVWNFMGETVLHLLSAGAMFFFALPTWYVVFRRLFGNFNDKGKLVNYRMNNQGDGTQVLTWISGCVIVILGFVALITAG